MVDQSFSPDNLRRLVELENRKGRYLAKEYFPQVERLDDKIKHLKNIRNKLRRKKVNKTECLSIVRKVRRETEREKENTLLRELEDISHQVYRRDFIIELEKDARPKRKTVYVAKNSAAVFLATKQLQKNLHTLYKVKQSSRDSIVSQVKSLLSDNFPKYVLRTDIKNFYDSISQKMLLEELHRDNLLSPVSKRLIAQTLKQFRLLSKKESGVPRGMGISAYLAELFMRSIDDELKNYKDEHVKVVYYARYVDDMLIIAVPLSPNRSTEYGKQGIELLKCRVREAMVRRSKMLRINNDKTQGVHMLEKSGRSEIEYLGYKFNFGKGGVTVTLSEKRKSKYRQRLRESIARYRHCCVYDERRARSELAKRIRFLTGNTRLKNRKSRVLVGAYYSNQHITETTDLRELDKYLQYMIVTELKNAAARRRIIKYSFEEGWEEAIYHPFKVTELTDLTKDWSV